MQADSVLFFLILVAGFYMAWNIGANDVANAMGTSVGSKALRIGQAIFLAAVLEFFGAFFFGSHVSETIQSGIIDPQFFTNDPKTLVLGMLAALIGTGIWLQIASYWGWPVSGTHTLVGSLMGFGAVVGGIETVYWGEISLIILSWIVSPLMGGLLGFSVFTLLRNHIFYHVHPVQAAKRWIPFLAFLIISSFSMMLLFHGIEGNYLQLGFLKSSLVSLLIGALAYVFSFFLVSNFDQGLPETSLKGDFEGSIEFLRIEKMFGYLQVVTAALMAFSHGANDVANAIGPLSASIAILTTGTIPIETGIPSWALALGGFGIVAGLATWGWRVIETIGKKITELTPTRGFAAEFGASFTVLAASRMGFPISTTHTLVGAVIGVGLARGLEALNLGMMKEIIISWVITVPVGAMITLFVYGLLEAVLKP